MSRVRRRSFGIEGHEHVRAGFMLANEKRTAAQQLERLRDRCHGHCAEATLLKIQCAIPRAKVVP